jgi:deoxyribodipyrimidine photo-lyase
MSFIHAALYGLRQELGRRGSDLIVLHGDPVEVIPRICAELNIRQAHANRDYEPYAKQKDGEVARLLAAQGAVLHLHNDRVVFEPDMVRTVQGTPFKVYTPYRNAWLRRLNGPDTGISPVLEETTGTACFADAATLKPFMKKAVVAAPDYGGSGPLLDAGESFARTRLDQFVKRMDRYADDRDFPAVDGTSGLSEHLNTGTISIRGCVRAAIAQRDSRGAMTRGASAWLSELIWREFSIMVLDSFPHVVEHAFRPEYDTIKWPGGDRHFAVWCEGRTGYPIVDAAMRCLCATGRMHNRLRMITAMFLVKDLLVDWRKGEEFFARNLLDFDLALNNMNWQWCASTGCDAQPWFRIFNPVTQSRRFDPGGVFIREWCPELADAPDGLVHWPHVPGRAVIYPRPAVDHAAQRECALALFDEAAKRKATANPAAWCDGR